MWTQVMYWVYSYFKKGCWKKCARDNLERYYGLWPTHCSSFCSYRTYCFVFLALANVRQLPLVPFFQISLTNSELKNTHNTFRGLSRALFCDNLSRNSFNYGSLHGARGWGQKQVVKHYSIAPKDLDIQTRFILKNSRNKFDWSVHEVL